MRFTHIALVLIAIFVVEMYLFIEIGGEIGAFPTIALVFITAALGVWMLRQQSLSTLRRASMATMQGQAPVREAAEGIFLLIGGVLLLIPGFFTDVIGFLFLFRPTRALLTRRFRNIESVVSTQTGSRTKSSPQVIEGEWKRDSE